MTFIWGVSENMISRYIQYALNLGPKAVLRKLKFYLFDRHIYFAHEKYRHFFKAEDIEEPVNDVEIRMFGLRRSGNHAIANWILEQAQGNSVFLNNVKLNKNPFIYRYVDYPDKKLKREIWGDFSHKSCLMYSFEDVDLRAIDKKYYKEKKQWHTGRSKKQFDVLVLRDPFNMYASRLKGLGFPDTSKSDLDILTLWCQYAAEFLDETDHLPAKKIPVSYNEWCRNKDYRKRIAESLGLQFTDKGFKKLAQKSSFEGKSVKNAQNLNTLSRWKHFADNPDYLNKLKRDDVIDYSQKIFPGLEVNEILPGNT
jgi:hypothetical protein